MARITTLTIVTLAVFYCSACNAVPKSGRQARMEANSRVSLASSQIQYGQAEQYLERGQFDKALDEIQNAILQSSDVPPYYILLGRVYLETKRLEPAMRSFSKAVEIDPEFARAHYFLGVVHERWSNDEEAYGAYMKAFDSNPTEVGYILAAAEMLVSLKRFEEARSMIEPRLAAFEHDSAMYEMLGHICMLQNDSGGAVKHYRQALLMNPGDKTLMRAQVRALTLSGDWSECLVLIKRLQLDKKADQKSLLMKEIECLENLGRRIDCRNALVEYTRQNPTDIEGFIRLGLIAYHLNDVQQMLTCSSHLRRVAPDRYEGFLFSALADRSRGDMDRAIQRLWDAVEIADDPESVPSRLLDMWAQQQAIDRTDQNTLTRIQLDSDEG